MTAVGHKAPGDGTDARAVRLTFPSPNEKQLLFFRDRHRYVAFGGARGGGKSWAVRVKAALLAVRWPGITVLIVRRTYPELRSNHIEPIQKLLPKELARYHDGRKEHVFINGSVIRYRYCDGEKDMARYQGTEADVIFIDEATQFDEKVFRMFAACLRGVNGFPKRMYLTCNPGGRGHAWVKRLFVDRRFQPGEDPEEYSFIRALVSDNRALMREQPQYVRQLETLPPKLREAWLYGRWDIFDGQFFEEFTDRVNAERRFTHVIEPFVPPRSWKRFRSFDFGYARPFSFGWWAMDPDGRLYRILELYGCTERPDEGVKWSVDRIFAEARRIEDEHPYLRGLPIEGVADPAIWESSRGPSIADIAARHAIYFRRGDNKRIPGWMQMHRRLAFDAEGYPMLYVFSTCKAFIRTVPALVYSTSRPEDLDTTQEDHVADETRYLCMMDPLPPTDEPARPARPAFDPLELAGDSAVPGTDYYAL